MYSQEDNNTVLTPDMKYSGAILNDKFLLPVKVTGLDDGTYNLDVPGAGIRIWGNADRSGRP